MIKRLFLFSVLHLILFSPFCLAQEEYEFDVSELEKRSYHIGGYAEFRPIFFVLDRDAALYHLRFLNRDEGKTVEEYDGKLLVDGSYEKGIAKGVVRANLELGHSYLGWDHELKLYEGYLSLKPSSSFIIDLGKKTLKWGKGYAWNPVAFIDRAKDPDDPELALEGFIVASADYIKSYSGPLTTLSLTPVFVPVYDHVNTDFGELNNLNFGGKVYALFYDTDIDFLFLVGKSKTNRFGIDFSRNITTNFETHGEFAFIKNQKKKVIDSSGTISDSESDAKSYLFGIRYLTTWDMTFIFEYYYNGTGYSQSEMEDYFSLIHQAHDLFLSTGDDSFLEKAAAITEGNYARPNPMQDYLYLRVSQKDPYNILYFTPALTTIMNLDDQSISVSPELMYTGFTNWELRIKGTALIGQRLTEYGEKQNDYRLEFRLRYYF